MANKRIWLASPTMHGEEFRYMKEAYDTNWMSTVGENLNKVEEMICDTVGIKNSVALSSGTAALHLAIKLAAEHVYGKPKVGEGALQGHRVFCSDMTFDATVNPIIYENGDPIFIDIEPDTWNLDPEALEKAIKLYPDVKILVLVNLYGTPAKMREIRKICYFNKIVMVEDAAESLGATYETYQTGTFGEYNAISFNGNKIITGSAGGAILTHSKEAADKARKWSTQARENAPWYQHEEIGYNYRMSNVIAGVVRGQIPYLQEHIEAKEKIYQRYKEGLSDLPIRMNPYIPEKMHPNFWLSCMTIDPEYMCQEVRSDNNALYIPEAGRSCPSEILEKLAEINAEGRPIWKPMHMQPIYRMHHYVTTREDLGKDIFTRGLCLPSDIKMTEEDQDRIISVIHHCFN